jgi:hypothetical protein
MIENVIKSILVAGLIMSTMMIPNSPERRIIVPANGAKPVGPYTPGLLVGDYLYASGQGVRDLKMKKVLPLKNLKPLGLVAFDERSTLWVIYQHSSGPEQSGHGDYRPGGP